MVRMQDHRPQTPSIVVSLPLSWSLSVPLSLSFSLSRGQDARSPTTDALHRSLSLSLSWSLSLSPSLYIFVLSLSETLVVRMQKIRN